MYTSAGLYINAKNIYIFMRSYNYDRIVIDGTSCFDRLCVKFNLEYMYNKKI